MKTSDRSLKATIDNKTKEKTGTVQRGKNKATRRFMMATMRRVIRKNRMASIKGTATPMKVAR